MIRIVAVLAAVFAKIGLFTLGGGLAIIALVQQEMLSRGWLTQQEFLDILGVAQVTPGAMGVNAATFVGWRVAENGGGSWAWALLSSAVASVAVMAASVAGVAVAGGWFERNRQRTWVAAVFAVLRPVVAGAIFAVGANLVLAVFGAEGENGAKCIYSLSSFNPAPKAAAIAALSFVLTVTRRFSPVWGLAAGAAAGLLF